MNIQEQAAQLITDILGDNMPIKEDPYVGWHGEHKGFYISTTDDESYHGIITMEAITDLFIEDHQNGTTRKIDIEDVQPFIDAMQASINRVTKLIK